mmetsp:Transcript_17104/g.36699  ORF Transcript_17104/g.36699 Transcript_17104/m.36699 type:complete len:398 (+) Transcript_17104:433-1626(+)
MWKPPTLDTFPTINLSGRLPERRRSGAGLSERPGVFKLDSPRLQAGTGGTRFLKSEISPRPKRLSPRLEPLAVCTRSSSSFKQSHISTPTRTAAAAPDDILDQSLFLKRRSSSRLTPSARTGGSTSVLLPPLASPRRPSESLLPCAITPRGFARDAALRDGAEHDAHVGGHTSSACRSHGSGRGNGRAPGRAPPHSHSYSPKLDHERMQALLKETAMTRTELFRLFNRFKALCKMSGTPGAIDKKTFKEGVSSLAFEDDAFVDRIFKLLDEDGSGTVEWKEFVNAVNALETGSPFDKLNFCFRVYDRDNNKSIEREELQHMFTEMLMFDATIDKTERAVEVTDALQELIDDFVNSIYDSIDADRSESLEFDEVAEAINQRKISDVWEVFGRTLVRNP